MSIRLSNLPVCEDRFKGSFHSHIYTNFADDRWCGEPGPRDLAFLVDKVLKKGCNFNAITNFGDEENYEFWTSKQQINELSEEWGYYQDDYVTAVVRKDRKPAYFFKSQELPTQEGHVLFFGLKRGDKIQRRRLEDALNEADEKKLLKIADHLYSTWHGIASFWKRLFRKSGFHRLKHRFDAYEYNSNCWISNRKTEKQARRDNKPFVANPDEHRPKDICNSYNIFESKDLKYNSGYKLVQSIIEHVKARKFRIKKGRNSLWSILHHVFMVGWYKLLQAREARMAREEYYRQFLPQPALVTARDYERSRVEYYQQFVPTTVTVFGGFDFKSRVRYYEQFVPKTATA